MTDWYDNAQAWFAIFCALQVIMGGLAWAVWIDAGGGDE